MSQWGVQLVIGKLLTDEEFRGWFELGRRECLTNLRERGLDLSETEIGALVEADPAVWSLLAARIDQRLQHTPPSSDPGGRRGPRALTVREQDVMRGVFDGLTNKQIAADLGVSEGAVKATLQHLFRKVHVRTRAQLVRVAFERSLGVTQRGR
jgi:DNA-binding NarL/FixJ family response regulator